MKKGWKNVFFMMAVFVICTMMFNTEKAMGIDPGSNEDPLVSKSYVDAKIKEVTDLIEVMTANDVSNQGMNYEVVNIEKGKTLVGGEGTEVILRGGKGLAIGSSQGGLQDITEGVDIAGGTQIPKYHLLIIPRGDGRGVYIESNAVFMIRGEYEILP